MTDAAQAIAVTDLHKRFGPLEVLKGVSLTAKQGDVIAIIGGSGSGKSTFLRCINLLELPTAGSVSATSTTALMTVSQSGRRRTPCSYSISPWPGPSNSRQW